MITTIDRVCQQCERHFLTPAWKVKQGKGKFCSVRCFNGFQTGKPSLASAEKLSQAIKASYQQNPERAISNSRIMKALWQDLEYRKGFLSNRDTPEAKRKHFEGNSIAAKRMWLNPESRRRNLQSRKQTHETQEYKIERSRLSKAMWQNPQIRAKIIEGHKPIFQDPQFHEMMSRAQSKAALVRWQNPEYRKHQEDAQKRSWKDPGILAKRFASLTRKPNKLEQKMIGILNKHLPEFKYNGDFSLGIVLGGLIPDFVNVNGKKQVIEVLGDYFHSPEIVGNRWQGSELGKVMIYNSIGWKCLTIWEHELNQLNEDEIVDKVKSFSNKK